MNSTIERVSTTALDTYTAHIDQRPAAMFIARLAPGSRRTMLQSLNAIAAILVPAADAWSLPWGQLRYQHTAALRTVLAERFAVATANKMLSALRGILKEAHRLGQMTAEQFARASDVEAVKGSALPRGRALEHGELRALFEACNSKTPSGLRDRGILGVLYGAGLRRSEIVTLDLSDFDANTGALRVHGKGNKERFAYAVNGMQRALAGWIEVRGPVPGPLFTSFARGRTGTRLTDQSVMVILQRLATKAKVAAFSPHDLRRTFISDLLDAGADISSVQQLAGHAQVTTTSRYDRRGEHAKRKAAGLLHVPC